MAEPVIQDEVLGETHLGRPGPMNHVLDGVQIPKGMGTFEGHVSAHCKV